MAKIPEMELIEPKWSNWVASRPACVQELIKRLPPDRLYLLKNTMYRVTIYSYSEDGTVTVNVSGEYNVLIFPRRVFGIKPDELEECDLPGPGEPHGVLLTDIKEIEEYVKERWGSHKLCDDPRCEM